MLARRSHETILKSYTGPSGEGGGAKLAPATTMTKQKLSFTTISVKEPGYLFVYLSYDNDSNNCLPAVATAKAGVYFDDFKITHTPTNVIQYNEYYPFGLQTSNSWTREGNVNDYLYNAGSELNGNSGWYETFFRGYDPVLGRFMQVDPMAPLSSFSPYNFALNDPAYYNDPMGDYVQARLPPPFVGRSLADIFGTGGGGGGTWRIGPGSGNYWTDHYGIQIGGPGYSDWTMSVGGLLGYRHSYNALQRRRAKAIRK